MSEKVKKATIEDAFNKQLNGEVLQSALDFAAYMRENKFTFKAQGAIWDENSRNWNLQYKGTSYAPISIENSEKSPNTWGVWCNFDSNFEVTDNTLKETILSLVISCPQASCKKPYCSGVYAKRRENWSILDKTFESVCYRPIKVFNPNPQQLETIQQILMMYKKRKDDNDKLGKPKIEEIALGLLDVDNLETLTDFLDFLKENKLTPQWQSTNSWKCNYKNKAVCHIKLDESKKSWEIRHSHFTREDWFNDYEKYITDEKLKTYILDNIKDPANVCGRGCKGKQNKTILGKKFDAVCNCWPLQIKNPQGDNLECEKKLITVIKTVIADFTAAKKAKDATH